MCQRIKCPDCNKASFAGCGRHVEQVLGDVPPTQRCACRERRGAGAGGTARAEPSFFDRLFGK